MLEITVNSFKNIGAKFHNDQRKTIGDIHSYLRGDLLLLNCLLILPILDTTACLTQSQPITTSPY